MKVLSLFDGISCARVALEKAGFVVDKYYASEIDKYAIEIAQKNYPDTIQVGSVVGLDSSQFKDIELLVGGSPCQDLSIAKKDRKGLDGERSGLFWEYVRILKEVKPKYFILENVNSMPKEAKQTITEALGVEPIMINAALVSAQNRKRLFWVGKLVGDRYEQVDIELPEDKGILLKDILQDEVEEKYYVKLSSRYQQKNIDKGIGYNPYSDSPVNEKARALNTGCGGATTKNATTIRIGKLNSGGQGDRIYSQEGKSVSIMGTKTGLYAIPIEFQLVDYVPRKNSTIKINDKAIRCSQNKNGASVAESFVNFTDVKAGTLTTAHVTKIIEKTETGEIVPTKAVSCADGKEYPVYEVKDGQITIREKQYPIKLQDGYYIIRKLTPIECERLQSLPDNYTEVDKPYILDKDCGIIEVWKNVLLQIAKEKNKQIVVLACCTTKDLRDMAHLICQTEQLKSVNIVIEMQSQGECATNIIKIGIGTMTHSTQIKLESKQKNHLTAEAIKEELLTDKSIEMLWKSTLIENWEEMKLCTTLILTKLITELKTCTYAQEKSINTYTSNLKELAENLLKEKLLVSKLENTRLVSNTQRYKALGNAFNVDVVTHILKNME